MGWDWGGTPRLEHWQAPVLMFAVKPLGETAGLRQAPKLVAGGETPGGRRAVETAVEQALMRGLATA
jgi:hypothetical protein